KTSPVSNRQRKPSKKPSSSPSSSPTFSPASASPGKESCSTARPEPVNPISQRQLRQKQTRPSSAFPVRTWSVSGWVNQNGNSLPGDPFVESKRAGAAP